MASAVAFFVHILNISGKHVVEFIIRKTSIAYHIVCFNMQISDFVKAYCTFFNKFAAKYCIEIVP